MNISYNWLKRYLNLNDDAYQVARNLTSIGLEVGTVEKVQTIRGGLEGLVVAEVVSCIPHPNSDHLHITRTRIAQDQEPIQIVCGAPNVAVGQKVICATLGTVLYSGDESFTIKKSKIRGEESFGMLCAEDEIGIGSSHDGIIVLPADAPVGMPAKDYYHVEDDYLIEVDITPNRSDACSHYGVARDLYAFYKAHGTDLILSRPAVDDFKVDNNDLKIDVQVENTAACPRYSALTISGVSVHESPDWLQNALRTIGLRPINNVVDCTNYVLHEMGQALHAFDADKIEGKQIIVRNAAEGEPFVTLDEVERKLSQSDLMICNAQEPMCIAGVFGGLHSGVSEHTTNVFLESAYFDPVSIRKTARRHGLSTDASFRYERGCDPNNTLYVLRRCAMLIQETAGGHISMDVVDIKSQDFEPFHVELNTTRTFNLIGKNIGEQTLEQILNALEIQICSRQGDNWQLAVPRYRTDVQRECDVIEDILRIYGYNNIEFPEKVNTNLVYGKQPDPVQLVRRISEQLTAQGFNEIMNNSLTKLSYYENGISYQLSNCVRIKNPLSQDLGVLRQTLLFGGLESIARNVNRQNSNLRFYEFGNCYHFDSQKHTADNPLSAYSEQMHLALWLTGNKTSQSWTQATSPTTFYQLHAYILNILKRIGIDTQRCTQTDCQQTDLFADGLNIIAPNGKPIATLGIVSKQLLKQMGIDQAVFYADLDWNILLRLRKQFKPVITDLPRFPEVKRDLALLLDKQVRFAELRQAAFQTEKKLLKQVYLFDVYEGKTLDFGKKSYALTFILQDEQNTLKDKQIDNIMQRLQRTFEERFGAKLR